MLEPGDVITLRDIIQLRCGIYTPAGSDRYNNCGCGCAERDMPYILKNNELVIVLAVHPRYKPMICLVGVHQNGTMLHIGAVMSDWFKRVA